MAKWVKNLPAMWEPGFDPWVEKIPWRRERLPTPVFWSGELHGLYSPWGHKKLDMTERLIQFHSRQSNSWIESIQSSQVVELHSFHVDLRMNFKE